MGSRALTVLIPGCPAAPILVGILPYTDDGGGGRACIGPDSYGINVTVDCSTHDGQWRDNDWIGLASDGGAPCRSAAEFCPQPVPVAGGSWGGTKSLYR